MAKLWIPNPEDVGSSPTAPAIGSIPAAPVI